MAGVCRACLSNIVFSALSEQLLACAGDHVLKTNEAHHIFPSHSGLQLEPVSMPLHYKQTPNARVVGDKGRTGALLLFWTTRRADHTCMTVLLMDMSPGARCIMTGLRCHLAAASCRVSGIVAVNNRTCNGQARSPHPTW